MAYTIQTELAVSSATSLRNAPRHVRDVLFCLRRCATSQAWMTHAKMSKADVQLGWHTGSVQYHMAAAEQAHALRWHMGKQLLLQGCYGRQGAGREDHTTRRGQNLCRQHRSHSSGIHSLRIRINTIWPFLVFPPLCSSICSVLISRSCLQRDTATERKHAAQHGPCHTVVMSGE